MPYIKKVDRSVLDKVINELPVNLSVGEIYQCAIYDSWCCTVDRVPRNGYGYDPSVYQNTSAGGKCECGCTGWRYLGGYGDYSRGA